MSKQNLKRCKISQMTAIINKSQDFPTTRKGVVSSFKMTQLEGSERNYKQSLERITWNKKSVLVKQASN